MLSLVSELRNDRGEWDVLPGAAKDVDPSVGFFVLARLYI
jgi:hypothetical protein